MSARYEICVLPGDGIGPEVTRAAIGVLEAAAEAYGFSFAFTERLFGGAAIDAVGNPYPDETRASCLASDAVFFGAVGGPRWGHGPVRPETGIFELRSSLQAYANLRPIRSWWSGTVSPLRPELVEGLDLLIVRELTGGLYFGERGRDANGAFDTLSYSVAEIQRILRQGFRLAQSRRGHLTSVDQANVLDTSRLWHDLADELAPEYPDVRLDHQLVDSMTMKLVEQPTAYDVIVTENLFGDILSDLAASISGGIGLAPSASLADDGPGIFEPIHGTAPDIAGSGRANPVAMILTGAMMLRELGEERAADAIETATRQVLEDGPRTPDLGGSSNTDEVAAAVLSTLRTTASTTR
ncbi:MAG: 3-isopropylmalate dehydrogenase [Gaiellales bacterium]